MSIIEVERISILDRYDKIIDRYLDEQRKDYLNILNNSMNIRNMMLTWEASEFKNRKLGEVINEIAKRYEIPKDYLSDLDQMLREFNEKYLELRIDC